jgi:hypothetical protein
MPLFPTAFWKSGVSASSDGYMPPDNTTGSDIAELVVGREQEISFKNPNTGTMTVTRGALTHVSGTGGSISITPNPSITIPGGSIGVFKLNSTGQESITCVITWSVAAGGSGTYGTLTVFSNF